jgi:hypothetical protein
MSFGITFPEWIWPGERRKGKRREALPLTAYYWESGAPRPHAVKNISHTGMYLLTDDRWYANTLVTMTLARTDLPEASLNRGVRVMTRVIRSGTDGVAVAFVWPGKAEELEAGLTDERSIREFVKESESSYRRNLAPGFDRVVRSHRPCLLEATLPRTAVRPV